MKPFLASGSSIRSATMPITISSETSPPLSITALARCPIGVPAATAARSMSPVESCGIPNRSTMRTAWVPFPAPGGPRRINLIDTASPGHTRPTMLAPPGAAQLRFLHQAFVLVRHEVAVHLRDGVHGDRDDDQ